ncbi:glycoside hydrolase family 5 [Paenibacillus sp. CAA11]|uniref:cellulase family glycosylhydrolase n=1 Tax=Paenibacillus sp. CAA11 TaxID=1532905 RepID=UPI000D38C4B1|nr:cellulase family glycosylhydrolase [Paenibacillus sp. CAA11]AWB42992.1 glycoside hydrolase family 5 [Paenibacillus sp. CAA11]
MILKLKSTGKLLLALTLLAGALTYAGGNAHAQKAEGAPGYFHTEGSRIVDADGNTAVFNGLNWFGFETSNYSPHGLWSRSMDDMLDQVKAEGYNLIRLPFSSQMFDADSRANSIDVAKNPDLAGLKPIEIMDKLIEKAGERGIRIFLDRHRPDSGGQSELWYTAAYPEERWISDWVMLAKRYAGNPTVIGADLHNEPHGPASWGTGDPATDWRLAAQRAGNAILEANPNWLIIVEGIEKNVKGNDSKYWWGGNLTGVRNYPVELKVPGRLVYSPHDYGPGVASQSWFSDPSFPANLPALWDATWGYISREGIAPLLVGEFGGRSVDTTSAEGQWQNALVDYIKDHKLYWTYWTLNPNSGDTGGLLLDDWATWNRPKQEMLKRLMKPVTFTPIGSPGGEPEPESIQATPFYRAGETNSESNAIRASLQLHNGSKTPLPLHELTIRYWYTSEDSSAQTVEIDYAQIGKSHLLTKVVPLKTPVAGADTYAEFSFAPDAGHLAALGSTGDIQFRIHKDNWAAYNQADDYSFVPAMTDYSANKRITVYYKGKLIYGVEPS